MNIFVASLNFRTNEDSLQSLFEQYGEVDSCKIIYDKFSGKSKGFGFVEMPDDAKAREAIEALNDTEFEDRNLVVKEARPR
ncbi:MAG: RNA-binding protein [Bacteroidia bacterium]|nr:RNA-binding protein [Bacteroidia bacterium]